jgi:hypothetical protein
MCKKIGFFCISSRNFRTFSRFFCIFSEDLTCQRQEQAANGHLVGVGIFGEVRSVFGGPRGVSGVRIPSKSGGNR